MTPFDIVVIAILGLCLVYSVFRGLVKEIFSLLAVVGGFLLALHFQDQLGRTLEGVIKDSTLASALGFGIVFVAALVGITLVGKLIRTLLHSAPGFSTADRLLGGVVGLIKGMILLLIAFYPLQFFPDLGKQLTRDSVFEPYIRQASAYVGKTLEGAPAIKNAPSAGLDNVKKGLEKMRDIGKISERLKWKSTKEIEKQGEGKDPANTAPQDNYTKDDKKKLQEILLSVDKDQ
ncbi:MAG: CvpA family protein [Nitrospinaceae bacterium]|jgi:membrane protein required for colicin V production|nr:MAG: CvpA family protein [Nitrospinaceae bacterium]